MIEFDVRDARDVRGRTSRCSTDATTSPDRIQEYLHDAQLATPVLVVDLDVVVDRYDALSRCLPQCDVFYAVKANPAPEVISLLARLGAGFDVASPGEIDLCLDQGVSPARLSYGHTVKKAGDIRYAFERGVQVYAFDTELELAKLLEFAPEATAVCRLACDGIGADWPLSRKFGTTPDHAVHLLQLAAHEGMDVGLSFHVGSQQRSPEAWRRALDSTSGIAAALRSRGVSLGSVNVGGGFPGRYLSPAPRIEAYGSFIGNELDRPELRDVRFVCEPGRYLVADAGVIETSVVLVSDRPGHAHRWVYLDIGIFNGLAEALDEAIRYRILPARPGPTVPCVVAGPTCDSVDVLYERNPYDLPKELEPGDRLYIAGTGAYTTTYSSVGFNGLRPLDAHYLAPR